jgi:hypothetical protein
MVQTRGKIFVVYFKILSQTLYTFALIKEKQKEISTRIANLQTKTRMRDLSRMKHVCVGFASVRNQTHVITPLQM